jgi:malic enzyme
VQRTYPQAILQWEDLLKGNAIHQLHRFRDRVRSFNDDIQGTASVVLAGLYGALRVTGQKLKEQKILFAGAGASAQGISEILVTAMEEEGLSTLEARRRIWMVDSQGLVTRARLRLEDFKEDFARPVEDLGAFDVPDRGRISLEEAVAQVVPSILLGTSGTPGTFTEAMVGRMAAAHNRPVVFPLSNPTSKSECTPADAFRWSNGRAIVATGSPFSPVEHEGTLHRIGQCNNAFIFPGVGLGVWVGGADRVTAGMFLDAAKALAGKVMGDDLAQVAVYPQLTRIRECSHSVACAVIRRAVAEGHAREEVLENLEGRVSDAMWFPEYRSLRLEQDVAWWPGAPSLAGRR